MAQHESEDTTPTRSAKVDTTRSFDRHIDCGSAEDAGPETPTVETTPPSPAAAPTKPARRRPDERARGPVCPNQ